MKERKLKNIEVGLYQGKVGISLCYPDQEEKEHVLFAPDVALKVAREIIALATALQKQGFRESIGIQENVNVKIH